MTDLPVVLPAAFGATRRDLQRVAVHVCARRRHGATGRFGLRPTAGGFGTPAFGDADHEEVLRIAGATLLREQRGLDGMHTTMCTLDGKGLGEVARFADALLDEPFSVGVDTPELGNAAAPLAIDVTSAEIVGTWYSIGARALDRLVVASGDATTPSVMQLWPEHFDLACDLAVGSSRVNLGVSPGDGASEQPYAYVGPWAAERPGDAAFWNAPFGALLPYDAVCGAPDAVDACVEFFARGLALLAS